MDFDEYEYLEKMVENPEPQKSKEAPNGGEELVNSGEERKHSSRHRGEDDNDVDRKSKRYRSGDDACDHDRHREKSSSRHRSRSRDVERTEKDGERGERHKSSREHRDREREERNGRDRDRDKERDGDRERDRDSGRKERHREKDSEKERERDKDERDRRSRSHSERHRDDVEKSRDREHREKSRDREHREKSREKEFREKSREREFREKSRDRDPRERDSRRHKEKKDETADPEVDNERDLRTVFAYQLPLRADERDIFEFFSKAGKVRDVRLIMDRNSRRSKGVGYIEFYDAMSVPMAIALTGQLIHGQPVMVKPSEAEKNQVQSTSTAGGALTGSGAARRLYVGNLVPHIAEEQLRTVFETFGTIELVQLPRDEMGFCKGFAFIQFARLEDAKAALTVNGQIDIGGRHMKVSAVTDQPGMQDTGATNGDLDDDEGGGLLAGLAAELMWNYLHLLVTLWYLVKNVAQIIESYLVTIGILKKYKSFDVRKVRYLAIVVESDEARQIADVIELLQWVAKIGVRRVCLYDMEGVLKESKDNILADCIAREWEGVEGVETAGAHLEPSQLTLEFASIADGREGVVRAANLLFQKYQSDQSKPKFTEPLMGEALQLVGCSGLDPDLLLVYGPIRCHLGFPAWRLRYTEIVHMGCLKNKKYGSLIKAIYRFTTVRQNYGK